MSNIVVVCQGDPEISIEQHIQVEVQRYSKLIAQNPRAGGPLTLMESGILVAYLRDALKNRDTQNPETK